MDFHFSMPLAPLLLLAAAAVTLFALGHVLARRRRTAPMLIPAGRRKTMMPLLQAAADVTDAARREHMTIADVAERGEGGSLAWFARSIAGVVPVYRVNAQNAFEKIVDSAEIVSNPQALYIQKRDYQTYVRWARSMQ